MGDQQWQPPPASLNTLTVLELAPRRLSFFKYLKGIYTPVQNELEVNRTEKAFDSELTERLTGSVKASQSKQR